MPGTDGDDRGPAPGVVATLTTASGLAFVGWLAFALRQVSLVRRVSEQQFAGVWEQRLEVLSFLVLAPNIVALAPAAAAAATATWMAGPGQELRLAVILRLIRWSAAIMIVIGGLSIVVTLFGDLDSAGRLEDVMLRIGGMLIAGAMVVVCRGAERTTPGA